MAVDLLQWNHWRVLRQVVSSNEFALLENPFIPAFLLKVT